MISIKTLQATQTADFVRLFEYVQVVGKELGEKKAWKLLEQCITKRRKNWVYCEYVGVRYHNKRMRFYKQYNI